MSLLLVVSNFVVVVVASSAHFDSKVYFFINNSYWLIDGQSSINYLLIYFNNIYLYINIYIYLIENLLIINKHHTKEWNIYCCCCCLFQYSNINNRLELMNLNFLFSKVKRQRLDGEWICRCGRWWCLILCLLLKVNICRS